MTDPTYAQLVERVGERLYGREWLKPMAHGLPAAQRTVERVAAAARDGGDYPAAKAWLEDMARMVTERKEELDALLDAIDDAKARRAAERRAREG